MSVEIRVSEHMKVLGILNGFPSIEVPGGVQMALGDAYGDEARHVVFAMHVPSLPTLGPVVIGEVVLRYVTIGDQIKQHQTRIPLNVNLVSSGEAAAAGLDTEVSEEVVILESARAQRESPPARPARIICRALPFDNESTSDHSTIVATFDLSRNCTTQLGPDATSRRTIDVVH